MTNPRSDFNEMQDSQPSGSKTAKSIGVHASNNENSDSENDDFPLRASKMKDLKHTAKPLFLSESDANITIHSDEESDIEEDYHNTLQRLHFHVAISMDYIYLQQLSRNVLNAVAFLLNHGCAKTTYPEHCQNKHSQFQIQTTCNPVAAVEHPRLHHTILPI